MKIDPTDAIEASRPLIACLQAFSIPCYFGGSIASSVHGTPRSTIDADIVADIRPNQVDGLYKRLNPIYYADLNSIHKATKMRESFNLLHRGMHVKIDIFVQRHYRYERQVMERIQMIAFDSDRDDDRLPFCSVEDIILNKLMWYDQGGRVSERQWSDLQGVIKIQRDALDRAYLDHWSRYLDIAGLLQEAYQQAGLD